MKNTFATGFVTLSFLFVFSMTVRAQDEEAPASPPAQTAAERLALEQAERERPAMKDVTISKKITGRLPNGYRTVVTSSQRDDIYKIQKEYNELIELLKLRIAMMETERDRRVDGVLTEEQVEKLRQTRGSLESERKEAQKEAQKTKAKTAPKKKISTVD